MTDRFRYYSRSLRSSVGEISAAVEWLRELARRHGVGEDILFKLELCAAEVLANVADHAYAGAGGEIEVGLFLDQGTATLTVTDGGPPFDPLAHTLQPLPDSLENARIGGLGVRLVREYADGIAYDRIGDRNRLTLRFGGRALVPRGRERRGDSLVAFPLMRRDGTAVNADERRATDRRTPATLGETALFRGVPREVIDRILPQCEIRACEAEEILFRAGEYHRCVLVNLDGRLRVHLDDPKSEFYFELGPGESIGELSVADGKPVSAWVVAANPGRLLAIPEPVFLETVLAVPQISRNLIMLMSERTRRRDAQMLARVRAAMELEALQRELDVARQIQSSMLPVPPLFSGVRGIEGRGFMRAARHVGGDFYDAFPLSYRRVFVAIGDVCGKGTPAALFMVRTLTLLRSEAVRLEDDAVSHLARIATRCNDLLSESNEAQQFVTLFCAIVDIDQGRIDFVNAGHNPPLLRPGGGEPAFLTGSRNPLAGIIPGIAYSVATHEFPPGSLLVLYTDGVTEAENSDGAMFGEEPLQEIVAHADALEVDGCVDRVVAAVDAFAGEHPQADDITVLAIRRPG